MAPRHKRTARPEIADELRRLTQIRAEYKIVVLVAIDIDYGHAKTAEGAAVDDSVGRMLRPVDGIREYRSPPRLVGELRRIVGHAFARGKGLRSENFLDSAALQLVQMPSREYPPCRGALLQVPRRNS